MRAVRFTLTSRNQVTGHTSLVLTTSPDGWDETKIKKERSIKYLGVFTSFSLPMKFVKEGAEFLRDELYTNGINAGCDVLIEKLNRSTLLYETMYTGEIDFNSFKDGEYSFETVLIDKGLNKIFKSNEGTEYSIMWGEFNSDGGYDGFYVDRGLAGVNNFGALQPLTMLKHIVDKMTKDPLDPDWSGTGEVYAGTYDVKSDLLTSWANKIVITNGRELQGSNGQRYGKTSFSDFFASINAITPIGVGIETIEGIETLVLEDWEYFFDSRHLPTLGTELVVNGTFDTNSDWSLGPNWAIADGKVTRVIVWGEDAITNGFLSEVGKDYRLTFEVTPVTPGALQITAGGAVTTIPSYASGLVTVDYTASTTDGLTILATGNVFEGSIDNVSVKEVLTAATDPLIMKEITDGIKDVQVSFVQDWNFNTVKIGYEEKEYSDDSALVQDEEPNAFLIYRFPQLRAPKQYEIISKYRADFWGMEEIFLAGDYDDREDEIFFCDIYYHTDESRYEMTGGTARLTSSPATTWGVRNMNISPTRLLGNWRQLLSDWSWGLDGLNMKFLSGGNDLKSIDTQNGVYTPTWLTEHRNLEVLDPKLIYPLVVEFAATYPSDMISLIETSPYGLVSFVYKDETYYGYLLDMGVSTYGPGAMTYKLILSTLSDPTNLIR